MKNTFSRFGRDPFGSMARAFHKLFIAPLNYRSRQGYDAGRCWQDRFAKHWLSLRGGGDEGLSEKDNEKMYREAPEALLALCRREHIDFRHARVLKIGCGISGFYTRLLSAQGVQRYVGVDITDVFFSELREMHPDSPAPEDFTGFNVGEPIPFRYSRMFAIKKP